MIYPKFLSYDDTIGVTAPSAGAEDEIDIFRINNAIKKLNDLKINVIETSNCRTSEGVRSSNALTRAKELESLFENIAVNTIVCLAGGEFLVEILSYLDFDIIKNNPKWLQGFSDITGISFVMTTLLDIATIYSYNFKSFAMNEWHNSIKNDFEILKGNLIEQNSFDMYENERTEKLVGDELFHLDTEVEWKNLKGEEKIQITGRIIGGCLDLISVISGTKYDGTNNFIEKYKEDGIIWYFDNCELSSEDIIRTMWKLKDLGYFRYVRGIVFGRTMIERSNSGISFADAIKTSFVDIDVPIIIDVDIGHKAPQMTIINGSIATIVSENGKGILKQELI